jgi:uncharacterized protein
VNLPEEPITVGEEFTALVRRIERLLVRVEAALPAPPQPTDWSAHAFRWRKPGSLVAVEHPARINLDDLLHIDEAKQALDLNTRQFLAGLSANNALLWGPRGTGKSSLVRALLTRYAGKRLRLIEVDAHDLIDLPDIAGRVYGRSERFIIFADDLSFEANDPSFKALKAMLDGSISATPENLLVYATSNRRHLMPEFMQENQEAKNLGGEIHHAESVEEKISLSERFGLWIAFHPFSQDQYLEIVQHWLRKLDWAGSDEWRAEALRFALARGSRSGRVAAQFARDWVGRTRLASST